MRTDDFVSIISVIGSGSMAAVTPAIRPEKYFCKDLLSCDLILTTRQQDSFRGIFFLGRSGDRLDTRTTCLWARVNAGAARNHWTRRFQRRELSKLPTTVEVGCPR